MDETQTELAKSRPLCKIVVAFQPSSTAGTQATAPFRENMMETIRHVVNEARQGRGARLGRWAFLGDEEQPALREALTGFWPRVLEGMVEIACLENDVLGQWHVPRLVQFLEKVGGGAQVRTGCAVLGKPYLVKALVPSRSRGAAEVMVLHWRLPKTYQAACGHMTCVLSDDAVLFFADFSPFVAAENPESIERQWQRLTVRQERRRSKVVRTEVGIGDDDDRMRYYGALASSFLLARDEWFDQIDTDKEPSALHYIMQRQIEAMHGSGVDSLRSKTTSFSSDDVDNPGQLPKARYHATSTRNPISAAPGTDEEIEAWRRRQLEETVRPLAGRIAEIVARRQISDSRHAEQASSHLDVLRGRAGVTRAENEALDHWLRAKADGYSLKDYCQSCSLSYKAVDQAFQRALKKIRTISR